MDCFVQCEKQYAKDIYFYISQNVDTSYTHLINTLRCYKNVKTIMFFAQSLKQLKKNNTPQIEVAEALWENFEFEQKNKDEKLKNKTMYETFWDDTDRKKNVSLFDCIE